MGAPLQGEAFPCPLGKMAAKGRSSGLPHAALCPRSSGSPAVAWGQALARRTEGELHGLQGKACG